MIPMLLAEAAAGASNLPGWIDELLVLAIKVLTPIVLLLVSYLVMKYGKKIGLENAAGLARVATDNVQKAINYADRWAKKQDHAETPKGDKKLEKALEYLIEIEGHVKIGEKLKDSLSKRIHTELEVETKATET